jgi:DNA-binding protein HU-beta
VTKTELVAELAAKAEITKAAAEKAINGFTEIVTETLTKGEKITLVGFGTFEVVERAARDGINPLTKKPLKIAAKKAPKFKAGKALKDAIAAPKAKAKAKKK